MAGTGGEFRLAVRSFRYIIRDMRRNAPKNTRSQLRSHQISRFFRWDYRDKQDEIKKRYKIANDSDNLKRNHDHQKLWKEVHKIYYSMDDRSVEETAKLIGAKLPEDPDHHHNV